MEIDIFQNTEQTNKNDRYFDTILNSPDDDRGYLDSINDYFDNLSEIIDDIPQITPLFTSSKTIFGAPLESISLQPTTNTSQQINTKKNLLQIVIGTESKQ
eukprot:TRINITY_DN8323_c0_g1_i1.p1 TRINITY_DN8323_c0_g1~~TRINITY_DN8323_c0_g1_i1.p1  ORF type:complete len:101 (+),score=16.42 TRINITY_DN8323_c0_g1_i1:281-583(+)